MWSIQLVTLLSLFSAATAITIPSSVNCRGKNKVFSSTEIQAAMTRGQTANPSIRSASGKDYPAHHGGYDTGVGAGKEFPIMSNGRLFASGDDAGYFRVVYGDTSNEYLGVVEHTGTGGAFQACVDATAKPTQTGLTEAPQPTKKAWGCKRGLFGGKKGDKCKREDGTEYIVYDDEEHEQDEILTMRWAA